ncbi:pentatricopeptide repeat-containing protein [Prunus yedoensis var. nudiflora]|uniref:Pentatricopeptide repeat-containing protein n=1 Tax=Prunus yedoensis var. nudiflora TaxID=2094558 RepID=A0A314ZIY0_PRUYE|nr:pentatricopeptide repeat-containing protein [Prunus yedoensis var. nudiflora]
MLQTRPLPSIVDFNPLLGQVAKLKHYSAAISLCKQMDLLPIVPNVCTLNIMINCFCHLAKLFKFGFEPDVATYNTLIKGFVIEDRISEAAALFFKLLEDAPSYPFTKLGQPNVRTYLFTNLGQPNVRTYTVLIIVDFVASTE